MATITGTSGADIKSGTSLADIINGLAGNDTLSGLGGNDQLFGSTGTDKLYGGDGADLLDGGTGILIADGGAGNDTVVYNPTTSTSGLSSFGDYFRATSLKGGTGYDTLKIGNAAAADASHTSVYVNDTGVATIDFGGRADGADYREVGSFSGFEKLILTGKSATYIADTYGAGPSSVVGTGGNDTFYGGFGSETFDGGAGNDTFHFGGGTNTLRGGAGNDSFIFDLEAGGLAKIVDFQGAGVAGGDTLHFDHYLLSNPKAQITVANGKTTFHLSEGEVVEVNAVGLTQGVDWFFVG